MAYYTSNAEHPIEIVNIAGRQLPRLKPQA